MTMRPENVHWVGFDAEQTKLLGLLDLLGSNGWAGSSQTEEVLPLLLGELHAAGVPLERVKAAMAAIGYDRQALHELERWESKRTRGRHGPSGRRI